MWETKFINIKHKKTSGTNLSGADSIWSHEPALTPVGHISSSACLAAVKISPLSLHKSSVIYISFDVVRDV